MPGGGADLGFAAVAVVVSAVVWFLARRRWRMAVARGEEVRRLAWLAAEEAARAEVEAAALAYVAPPLPSSSPAANDTVIGGGVESGVGDWVMPPAPVLPQCAVCYRHTTTRCSRCKAVKYCSGKCQIIHWRQGHKDECHPPSIDERRNSGGSVSTTKGLRTNGSDLSENSVEIETNAQPESPKTSPRRPPPESNSLPVVYSEDHMKTKPSVDAPGIVSTSDCLADSSSSSSLSSCSTFSGLLDTSDDASASDDPHVFHFQKNGKSPSQGTLLEDTITTVHNSTAKPKEDVLASADSSVNNLSCTNNAEQKLSTNKADDTQHTSSYSSRSGSSGCNEHNNARPFKDNVESRHNDVLAVGGSFCGVSSSLLPAEKLLEGTAKSNHKFSSEGTARSNHKFLAAMDTDTSSSLTSGRSADVHSMKAETVKAVVFSSLNHGCSVTGVQPVLHESSSSKNENPPAFSTKPVEATGSLPNGISDFKTSVKKVVQQLKSSHFKHPSEPRTDVSRKYKMLFPYDLFVKLYNCDKVDMRPFGLTNCGNSCYANAVLQCLAFTRPVTSYLLQGLHSQTCSRGDWCFMCEFERLLVKGKQGQSPLSPSGIISHIHNIGSNLGHGREEDAHEFLRYAIDTMQSVCLKEARSYAAGTLVEETTLIQLIFGGYLRSMIKCTRCRGKSERRERMMDLTVEIDGDIGTLEEALYRFTATEILDGENKYQCSRCQSYERARKKLTILEAPNVLTIALKRFQSGKFGKLNKAVRFPEILDLAPYMSNTDDKSPVYSLYAVVVHQDIMNAAFSGHYVCYVKSTQGKWYKTDDSRVKPVDVGSVLNKNAYMLFYARCSPRAPSLIRAVVSHDKIKKNKGRDSHLSSNSSSASQQRNRDHPPNWLHIHHSTSFNERLLFRRTDSSSDASSLLSCSDEGSCSTESTRDSTSTEELSEYIFGGSDRFSQNSYSLFSEESDSFLSSPLDAGHSYAGDGEGLSYGERLSWERGESPQFLHSDTVTNYHHQQQESRKLTAGRDCRGRETNSSRERRA